MFNEFINSTTTSRIVAMCTLGGVGLAGFDFETMYVILLVVVVSFWHGRNVGARRKTKVHEK